VQDGPFSAMIEGARRLDARAEPLPPYGKEFPMEPTQALTAITAIISFGFVAALILGMV
jgi:hypothetical protein